MADKLPRFIVLKSRDSGLCAYYTNGYICCGEKNVRSPYAKIEVEPSQSPKYKGFFHLRICFNNRYLSLDPKKKDGWIVAQSNQPVEDPGDRSSTLFEANVNDVGQLELRIANSSSSLRVFTEKDPLEKCIYVGERGGHYDFTFVDWESLVELPKHVALKGNNEMFLKIHNQERHPFLQFSSADGNESAAVFEVQPTDDGHVRVKSDYAGKFWRLSPGWIWADSSDETGKDKDTLFWPEKIDEKTVALRSAGNDLFCKRLTTDGKENCLNACVPNITNEAKLVVEELVLERSIYNVRYRIEDARIFDEKPHTVDTTTAVNEDSKPVNISVKSGFDEANSYNFSKSWAFKGGFKVIISAELPKLIKGSVELSFEATRTIQWGESQTVTKRREVVGHVTVPPRSRAKVACIGTTGKCNIPFSYTQKDKRSTDGQYVTSEHIDGVFEGVSNYNYHFKVLETEPL